MGVDPRSIDAYTLHGRIRGGAAANMMDAAYTAWASDERAGLASLLIADTNSAVAQPNTRARRPDHLGPGRIRRAPTPRRHLRRVGDRIVTRQIDRTTLRTGPQS